MDIKSIICSRRNELGLTMREVAEACGVSEATVSRWESGEIANMRREKIALLASVLKLSPAVFIGGNSEPPLPKNVVPVPGIIKTVPLYRQIACGKPIYADDEPVDEVQTPDGINADFAVMCVGDSMINAHIQDGDIVYIRRQDDVDDGQIAAVEIGEEATLKRVYHQSGGLLLVAANNSISPMLVTGEYDDVRILGKAVACLSTIK